MWQIRRVRMEKEIFLGLVYHVEGVPSQAIRNVITWYHDIDTTELEQQIMDAFKLPVVDSDVLMEKVF